VVATRTGRWAAIGAAVALAVLVFIIPTLVAGLFVKQVSESGCNGGTGPLGGPQSPLAADAIPANYLRLFHQAENRYQVPWNVLAGIGKVETDFGRLDAPGVSSGENFAGAGGPMQFLSGTWAQYGVDGNGDGRKDRYDPEDAVPGAANYLRASGAPQDMHAAIFAYNHAEWYVQEVMSWARRYAQGPTLLAPPALNAAPCPLGDPGVPGKVQIAPGANLPGRPITPETLTFFARVAGIYGRPLIVTTGTNHSKFTTSGTVSDHFDGHAGDFGMVANGGADDSPTGDRMATACLIAAGDPPEQAAAEARAGGLWTRDHDGLRIQCIWKTDEGGNHHNHVHMGARPE
jgi:hypothetical protein